MRWADIWIRSMKKGAIGLFIPIADDKISNEQCAMFITKDGREHNGMPVTQSQGADQEGSG